MDIVAGRLEARAVGRVLRGDPAVFDGLARKYYPVVYGMACAQTGNRSDAEDVAQEAFLRAYRNLASLKDPCRFGPWLMQIVRNSAYDLRARRSREAASVDQERMAPQMVVPDVERRELKEAVRRRIMELDAGQREILMLRYFSDKSLRQLATLLQISPNAANKRLKRAREALGKAMLPELEGVARQSLDKPTARVIAALGIAPLSSAAAATTHAVKWPWAAVIVAPSFVFVTFIVLQYSEEAVVPELETEMNQSASLAAPPTRAQLGYAIMNGSPSADVQEPVNPPPTAPIDSANARGSSGIRGRLIDVYGEGLQGYTLQLYPRRENALSEEAAGPSRPSDEILTGGVGEFVFEKVAAGRHVVYLKTPSGSQPFAKEFDVRESEIQDDVLLVFDPALRIWGRVVDSSGQPVAGANIQLVLYHTAAEAVAPSNASFQRLPQRAQSFPNGAFPLMSSHGRTDSDGNYHLFTPPQQSTSLIGAEAMEQGYWPQAVENVPPYGEFNFTLQRKPEIHGRVVDARNGARIESFTIATETARVSEELPNVRALQLLAGGETFESEDGEFSLHLDAHGWTAVQLAAEPRFTREIPQSYVMHAAAPGYAPSSLVLHDVAPDKVTDGVVIQLTPVPGIQGIVRTSAGKPVANALIRAGASQQSRVLAKSDAEGYFRLSQTSPPLTSLMASNVSYAPGWAEIRDGWIEFVLDAGAVLEFEVTVNGQPLHYEDSLSLETVFPGGETRRYSTEWTGKENFTLTRASTAISTVAAIWTSGAESAGANGTRQRLERPVEIIPEQSNTVSLDFLTSYPGRVTGTVSTLSGALVEATVAITNRLPNGDTLTTETEIGDDGSFLISNVPLGPYVGVVRTQPDSTVLIDASFVGEVEGQQLTLQNVVLPD